ncbi:MAG: (2Fe-2S)-binding protein [Chloroflexi bacterium]|nr:(2Fe-2S)-binding protein [Chloroflexota bacterium]
MPKKNEENGQFNITVFRYDPATDREGRYKTYKVPARKDMTILGALTFIYENLDSTLAHAYSCGWGECRGCMVSVDGRSVKACLVKLTQDVKIGPLPGREIVKDLVVLDRELVADRRLSKIGAAES